MRIIDDKPVELYSPEEFEIAVKNFIKEKGETLTDFQVNHLEVIEGSDGEYEIDVTAKFTVLDGAEIKVLIECKHYKRSVDRDKVMILNQKLQSTGAHKGMIFTTSKFQRGAVEFAKKHGIALAKLAHSEATYYLKSRLVDIYEVSIDEDDETSYKIVCDKNGIMQDLFAN
jgi:restriction system protein